MKKMNTRKMVYIGLLAAVATVLMYLELPLTFLFMPPFLKLDISGVPTLIGTFMFGPAAGIFITLVKDLIHSLSSQTGGVGELSDFLIYAAFSLRSEEHTSEQKQKGRADGLSGRYSSSNACGRIDQSLFDYSVLLQNYAH